MILYWVRHGETDSNARELTQGPDEPLNAEGLMQADRIAERVASLSIDTLFSSPFPRARETANTIGARIGREVTVLDDLHESMWAKQYWGIRKDDPTIIELLRQSETNNEQVWDVGSYEPWQQIVTRADSVQSFFEKHDRTALAVSHGTFSKQFALRMLLGDAFTLSAWNTARTALRASNTGLSVFEFKNGRWSIITWNDHAHLG